MDKLMDSRQKIKAINNYGGNLPLVQTLGQTFEERHKRLTIYLEHDVYRRLQERRLQGISQTKTINESLRNYLEN